MRDHRSLTYQNKLGVSGKATRPSRLLQMAQMGPQPDISNLNQSLATHVNCGPENCSRILNTRSNLLRFGCEEIEVTKDDFEVGELLHEGHYSEVLTMRLRRRNSLILAVKIVRLSHTSVEQNRCVLSDLMVSNGIREFPFIVKCYGVLFIEEEFWICMENMSTCLSRLMRDLPDPFPEYVMGKIVVSVIIALDYLKREHNMIHRDVKPSNILLGYGGEVKLCDFGVSGKLKESISQSATVGSTRYTAPERFVDDEHDVRADVWSLGISLYELATKSPAYADATSEFVLINRIQDDDPPELPSDLQISQEFREFVAHCLRKNKKERPKYDKLMEFKFFQLHNCEPRNVLSWLLTLDPGYLHQSNAKQVFGTTQTDLVQPNESFNFNETFDFNDTYGLLPNTGYRGTSSISLADSAISSDAAYGSLLDTAQCRREPAQDQSFVRFPHPGKDVHGYSCFCAALPNLIYEVPELSNPN